MAKYSIILPVRNGGQYVKECVNGILHQSYKDFNFIVLDNYSTDGTFEWLQSLTDSRLKIIPSTKSLTIEENWGRITTIEKNEFISLIGHDDILLPNFLEVIDGLIKTYPDATLYHTHFNYIDGNGKIIRPCKPMNVINNGHEFLKAFLTSSIDSMGTGYVMRSKDYDELRGIPVKYPSLLFADFELWLKLIFKSYEVVAPETCFAFRRHQSTTGLSTDMELHKALATFVEFLSSLEESDVEAKKIIHEFGSQFLLFYCRGLSHRLLRTPLEKRQNLTVRDFIDYTKKLSLVLGIGDQYEPDSVLSLKLASYIDSNPLLRKLFLYFKKIYTKPVLK